jgi:hypothetical protein
MTIIPDKCKQTWPWVKKRTYPELLMEGNNPNLIMDGWIPRFLSGWVDYPDGESCDRIGPIRELHFGR